MGKQECCADVRLCDLLVFAFPTSVRMQNCRVLLSRKRRGAGIVSFGAAFLAFPAGGHYIHYPSVLVLKGAARRETGQLLSKNFYLI